MKVGVSGAGEVDLVTGACLAEVDLVVVAGAGRLRPR